MVEIGRAFAIAALDLDAGDALQRFGRVDVGQLADVLCADRIDDLVGVLLDRLCGAQRCAHAGDDDVVAILRCDIGACLRRRLGCGGAGEPGNRHQRCAGQQDAFHRLHNPLSPSLALNPSLV
ncbi:hypothetical protein ACVOMT_17845 [Sphingomonas panni]